MSIANLKTQGGQLTIQDESTGADVLKILTSGTTATFSTSYTVLGLQHAFTLDLTAITALGGAAKIVAVAPFAGTITKVYGAIDGAITATDIVITARVNTTAVTNGVVTIPNSGSGFGTTASATPSAANTFVAGDVLNATITGGVGTVGGALTIYITRTA